ncbi:hypothetical protein LOD99_5771 [Oopsacas minuta]|uniref:Secreted protein n=1 Tax=Oopsacas minuta TaxID=111878 RepID=A0AAV7JQ19_9METZ|nr:hypothetical protein LOD99_5771 [Oopsacas minuta]
MPLIILGIGACIAICFSIVAVTKHNTNRPTTSTIPITPQHYVGYRQLCVYPQPMQTQGPRPLRPSSIAKPPDDHDAGTAAEARPPSYSVTQGTTSPTNNPV